MSYKFTDEDREEVSQYEERMPFGVNKVQLTLASADVTPNGADFIEIGVVNDKGIEDTARLYFSPKAAKYSMTTIKQILSHNVPDDEVNKAKAAVDKVKDTDELAVLITERMSGFELWFTKYYDPERTYDTDNGTFRSINTNIMGYEPKLKPELMPKPKNDDTIDPNDFPDDDVIGQGEPVQLEVPFESKGDVKSSIPRKNDW